MPNIVCVSGLPTPVSLHGRAFIRTLSVSARATDFQGKLKAFMNEHIYEAEAKVSAHAMQEGAARWTICPEIPRLQKIAKEQGLWNLWISKDLDPKGEYGPGLTNEEYATLAEIMGAVPWASEIFNCSVADFVFVATHDIAAAFQIRH